MAENGVVVAPTNYFVINQEEFFTNTEPENNKFYGFFKLQQADYNPAGNRMYCIVLFFYLRAL